MNTQAVPEWQSEIQRSRTTLLNGMLLTAAVGGLVALVLTYVSLPEGLSVPEVWAEMWPFLAGWLIALIALLWRGLGYRARALLVLLLAYILGAFIFYRGGLPGSGRVWMLLFPVLAFILLGPRPGIWAGIASVLTYAFFALVVSQGWLVPPVSDDPSALKTWFGEGGSFLLMVAVLTLMLWSFNRSWWDAMARAWAANQQLQVRTQELEETTKLLHRQTAQLQTTVEIAQAISSILAPETLLVEVANWIQEGFRPMGVYYVGLFLLDEAQQFAVLRAATGEAGQLLLEMGHKVKLDETSTIGWCIVNRQARIALDVEEGTVRFDALPMPHTRSEIGLPLRSRGRILGALSVQSAQEAAFSEADIAALQTMADQVAVAIDNARLFSQTEAALGEVQAAHRRYLAQAWKEFLAVEPVAQIDYTQPGTGAGDREFLRQARRAAMVHGRAVATDSPSLGGDGEPSISQTALVVPLKLRGQVIGTMALHETRHQRAWTASDIALAETVAEQVALTVENLRLMDEMQRRAARERLAAEVTASMRETLDIETVLKTAVQEVRRALGLPEVIVRLAPRAAGEAGNGADKQIGAFLYQEGPSDGGDNA